MKGVQIMAAGKKRRRDNQTGRICIALIVTVFVAVMTIQIAKLYQKDQEYVTREEELQSQLEDETEQQNALGDYEEYTQSREYIEDVAKSKLGLVYNNEIVFKEDEN